jgi:septal ring factor EnvC (AmiA/AmiB activator)
VNDDTARILEAIESLAEVTGRNFARVEGDLARLESTSLRIESSQSALRVELQSLRADLQSLRAEMRSTHKRHDDRLSTLEKAQ